MLTAFFGEVFSSYQASIELEKSLPGLYRIFFEVMMYLRLDESSVLVNVCREIFKEMKYSCNLLTIPDKM